MNQDDWKIGLNLKDSLPYNVFGQLLSLITSGIRMDDHTTWCDLGESSILHFTSFLVMLLPAPAMKREGREQSVL